LGIERQPLQELAAYQLATDSAIVDSMVAYFQRQSDQSQVKTAVKTKYGTAIKFEKDPAKGSVYNKYIGYNDAAFHTAVNIGTIATTPIGFGQRIINAKATMFTELGQRYALAHDAVEDPADAEELLTRIRKEGGYTAAVTRWDKRSIECASAVLLTDYDSGVMSYQVLNPTDVRPYFADTLTEKVEGEADRVRAAETNDIEDATVVIIRLSRVDRLTWNYLAIYGRSTVYPKGRHVLFQDGETVNEVPPVDETNADITDYRIDDEICNPLSKVAFDNPDMSLPEYPLAVLYGGMTDSAGVLPVSTSLYESSLTVDVAASHTLGTSQDAARGTHAFKRSNLAQGQSLPSKYVGPMDLPIGVEYTFEAHDSNASKDAISVLKDTMVQMAAGYAVPDYMVVTEDHTLDASSGVALEIKTRPMIENRRARIEENKPGVQRVFEIERSLLHLFGEESPGENLDGEDQLWGCTQQWDAGDIVLPENKAERTTRISAAKADGFLDEIGALREYHHLATDDEAIVLYEKMRDRAEEYPPLNAPEEPAPPANGSAFRRGQNNTGGQQ